MKELSDLNNIYQEMYVKEVTADLALRATKKADAEGGKAAAAGNPERAKAKRAQASRLYAKQAAKRRNEEVEFEPSETVKKLIESGKFSVDEVWKIVEVEEGYQRDPEKGEEEERKAEKRRKESGGMPPRGDKRREAFEKWYREQGL